jgi:hypothetical protein
VSFVRAGGPIMTGRRLSSSTNPTESPKRDALLCNTVALSGIVTETGERKNGG